METNELERRFERAFADEPPLRSVPDHLHRGQRAMVRHRVVMTGTCALAAVVVTGAALVATGLIDRDEPPPAKGDAALIADCKDASESKKDADLLFHDDARLCGRQMRASCQGQAAQEATSGSRTATLIRLNRLVSEIISTSAASACSS